MLYTTPNKYKFLLRITNIILQHTTQEELFTALASELRTFLKFDRFSISIYDHTTDSIAWFANADGIHVDEMDKNEAVALRGPMARQAITTREPIIIHDMSKYREWQAVRLMMDAGLSSSMVFPLIVRSEVLGTINISFREEPKCPNEVADFLQELSGQVALAVDNILTYNKLLSQKNNLEKQKQFLIEADNPVNSLDSIIYSSPKMAAIMQDAALIAQSNAPILITGETGTGKDQLAKFIHANSPRNKALFVKINCPALSPSLYESELFGHAKGAFTGAVSQRTGRFEMANGGTVFLDEVVDLSLSQQAKLLQILQDNCFERVGESKPTSVDIRVISATNVDLEAYVQNKEFRSDLYYRLNGLRLHLPPLRERDADILALTKFFTAQQSQSMHRPPPTYSEGALQVMAKHDWPGNVRELRNVIGRFVIMCSGQQISAESMQRILSISPSIVSPVQPIASADITAQSPSFTTSTPSVADSLSMAEAEKQHLEQILTKAKGVLGGKNGAASLLKLPRSTLQYKLRKHKLDANDFKYRD